MKLTVGIASALAAQLAWATPAPPSGGHPRLFMSQQNLAAFTQNASQKGTAAAQLVAACQDTIANPNDYTTRGGTDGNNWPGSAVNCAFAYLATQNAQFLTQAIKYWQASLNDDQNIGDGKGCVQGVNTNWQSWNGNDPPPPVIITITHDTGYPMRWYGPDLALTYDWLYNAPGLPSGILAQTRTCLTAWIDYYSAMGYHYNEPGANYNAGFVVGKTLGAIAIGTDGGADGHLWNETVTQLFPQLLVGQGLAGVNDPVGMPAGAMAGGDWLEGWQYGPLSVVEYAVSARALEENGAPQPEMDAWTNSLAVRYIHGTVPALDGQWVGGDFDSMNVYQGPSANELDAVLAGPSSDQAASWAAFMKQTQKVRPEGYVYNALAELRTVAPADYRAQTPPPAPWYLSRGSRAVYARTSWDATAYWGVFSSAPHIVDDHEHMAAGNFVFSRGADHLIVDPSNYGDEDTFETNAIAVDADLVMNYTPSQTPWSKAELAWARGTTDAVYAARSDFANAFIFADTPSTIPYAQRDWVMLPEGEVVTLDRVQTKDSSHYAYVNFHANTGGTMKLTGALAGGTVGGSALAIHQVLLSGGTASITQPMVGSCTLTCDYPCGQCNAARFAVDEYSVKVPGPWAVAIHVFDGLAGNESPAAVGSLNDDNYDPAPKQNAGVIGAAVYRGMKQSYVVASSAQQGAAGATLTYGVPGTSAARHIVFDAPEDQTGSSTVMTTAMNGRCLVTISAGSGFVGHPLMFQVASAADGCKATDGTNVPAASPPPGGGVDAGPIVGNPDGGGSTGGTSGGGPHGGANVNGGCGCVLARGGGDGLVALGAFAAVLLFLLVRRRLRAG